MLLAAAKPQHTVKTKGLKLYSLNPFALGWIGSLADDMVDAVALVMILTKSLLSRGESVQSGQR